MTSLVSWLGIDSHGHSSIYIVSDSKITWLPDNKKVQWEYGRKVFASIKSPEILGYYGDVLFPSLVLGQIINLIDMDLLFKNDDSHVDKLNRIQDIIKTSYPFSW